jgi:hypothetical protein
MRVARLTMHYLYGILKYARHPFTNARTEGMNELEDPTHQACARGYRNRDNFRSAILFHCGGLDMSMLNRMSDFYIDRNNRWPAWVYTYPHCFMLYGTRRGTYESAVESTARLQRGGP